MTSEIAHLLADDTTFQFSRYIVPSETNPDQVLRIFAYGTITDAFAQNFLPQLPPNAVKKLRLLTLVNIASRQTEVPIAKLAQQLFPEVDCRQELQQQQTPVFLHGVSPALDEQERAEQMMDAVEELIREAIQKGFLTGKISHTRNALLVSAVHLARDVEKREIANLIRVLSKWRERCDETVGGLTD
ncbi:unnamed protein product [Amoebophrya sp. A120]|nr:unnamed protein product [Amoebophrya sp. A120]|eukprot:GSA120T00004672001.1